MSGRPNTKRVLLRIWRDVPFPLWLRRIFLRILNPSFMVGAMALVEDEQARILVLRHTYRRHAPWGLPGGWLKRSESPEAGLAREVFEETGYEVEVQQLLAARFYDRSVLDLMYRCRVVRGVYEPTDETSAHRWVLPADLPELLDNQRDMLVKVGVVGPLSSA